MLLMLIDEKILTQHTWDLLPFQGICLLLLFYNGSLGMGLTVKIRRFPSFP